MPGGPSGGHPCQKKLSGGGDPQALAPSLARPCVLFKMWLGTEDSNLAIRIQSPLSWPQKRGRDPKAPPDCLLPGR